MAVNTRWSVAARNAAADARAALLNGGFLRLYDGAQPADPTGAVTTLLAELTFGTPAFGAAAAGVATANAITDDSSANATGTASWYRALTSGAAAIMDGSVGTAASNIVLNSTAIQSGARVSVTAFTITEPMQGA